MLGVKAPTAADPAPSLTSRSLPTARSPGVAGDRDERLGAWADWLATTWPWEWFFTGTFAPIDTEERPKRTHNRVGWSLSDKAFREWIDGLAARGSDPYWVRAREPHQIRRSTHFHALIGGVGNLRRSDAWRSWFEANGQARVDPIDSATQVAAYLGKYVLKSEGELVFSDNLARVRDQGYHEGWALK